MEGVVLALVCFTPWAFGSVDSLFEMVLDIGIALVLVLWGLRMLVQGQFSWRKCPIIVCLASLFLLGIWQLTPLSPSTLQRLAPATSQLYRKLLPKEPEALPGGEARGPAVGPIGSTLSLYPTATRRELVRLLAILLLFAAVRNNLSSPAALGRLSVAVLANGSLLALFGLIQFFSSPHGTVFWSIATPGSVFGPFLNRNHFAFYLNLCVGLGIALLLQPGPISSPTPEMKGETRTSTPETTARKEERGRSSRRHRSRPSRHYAPSQQYVPIGVRDSRDSAMQLLQHPGRLWILLPLVLMVSSMIFCLSRGAVVALVLATMVCLAALVVRKAAVARQWPLAAVGLVASAVLLLWFGLDQVIARLATLWEGQALEDYRAVIWKSAPAPGPRFAALGHRSGNL